MSASGNSAPGSHRSGRSELVTHAVVAALVTTVVAAMELGVEHWIREWAGNYALLVALVATFALAFAILYVLEIVVERRHERRSAADGNRPLQIDDLGDVCGTWVDVVSYAPQGTPPAEGTIMHVRGTRGTGLKVSGEAFRAGDLGSLGQFDTTTTFVEGRTLIYHYKGSKGNQHDSGVGFYRFWRDSSHDLRMVGGFLALSLKQQVRFVSGRRLRESELADQMAALRRFVDDHRHGAEPDNHP